MGGREGEGVHVKEVSERWNLLYSELNLLEPRDLIHIHINSTCMQHTHMYTPSHERTLTHTHTHTHTHSIHIATHLDIV